VIEILDSIPSTKNYLKDSFLSTCGLLLDSMWHYLMTTTLADLSNESQVIKHKLASQYTLRVLYSLTKNHPQSQAKLFSEQKPLMQRLYELMSQVRSYNNERTLTILAQDIIVQSFTNKQNQNDQQLRDYLQEMID